MVEYFKLLNDCHVCNVTLAHVVLMVILVVGNWLRNRLQK